MLKDAKAIATLAVSDLDRAIGFYRDVLELEPSRPVEGQGVLYDTGDIKFFLYRSEFAGTNKATAMGFAVEDVPLTVKELRERGAAFMDFDYGEDFRTVDGIVTDERGFQAAWFTDSEGNILSITDDPSSS